MGEKALRKFLWAAQTKKYGILTIAHNTSVQALMVKVHVVDDVGVGVSPPGALI